MTYIVNDNCIRCKTMDCVEVCPVDCFYEGYRNQPIRGYSQLTGKSLFALDWWWGWEDSNFQPNDYQPPELND
jgi:NAD-dependent dihydropyrimidine dehydrogenase PreA subunit